MHSLHPPPSRGKGSVTSRSSLGDITPTPQSSSISLRTAVADVADLSAFGQLKLTQDVMLSAGARPQRSASGETAVEDVAFLGDLSAPVLAAQLQSAHNDQTDDGSFSADAFRPFSLSDMSRIHIASPHVQAESPASEHFHSGLDADADGTSDSFATSELAEFAHSPPRAGLGSRLPTPRCDAEEFGIAVKPPPNGMVAAAGSEESDCRESRLPSLLEAQTESDSSSDDDNDDEASEPRSRRMSFGSPTPKLGGFGVRSDHVPHVEGMKSAATDRAKRHEQATLQHQSRQRSKSDSLGSRADRRGSKRYSSSGLVGMKREELPEAKEWGANFWCIITDPKTKASFFANPQTGECRWEVPAGTIVLPPNPDGEWWELYDEEKSIPYYYHTQTAKSVWVRPEGFVIPLTVIQESTLGRRFSRQEFGEERISARASLSIDSHVDAATAGPSTSAAGKTRAQPPPPTHSPSVEQVLAGKARQRIMGEDRAFAAQALAGRPLFQSSRGSGRSHHDDATPSSSRRQASDHRPRNVRVAFDGKTYDRHRSEASRSASALVRKRPSSSSASLRPSTLHPDSAAYGHGRGATFAGMAQASTLGHSPRRPNSRSRLMRESASEPRGLPSVVDDRPRLHTLRSADDVSSLMARRKSIRRERDPTKRLSPIESLRHKESEPPLAPEVKRLSTGVHHCMPADLQNQIQMLAFEGFALRKFTTHRVGPFRRKLPLDKMARWQRTAINAPLLHLGFKELQRDAVKIFKIIQRVMGDRDSAVHARPPTPLKLAYGIKVVDESARPLSPRTPNTTTNGLPLLSPALPDCIAAAARGARSPCSSDHDDSSSRAPSILEEERWVLERGLQSSALRDEIYAQLIKQLTDNPSGSSTFRGWQLLCVVVVTFPPSSELRNYLQQFIEEHKQVADEAISIMAQHCAGRLALTCRRGPRQSTPMVSEIQSASDAAFNPGVFGHSLEAIIETQRDAYPHIKVPIVLVFLCNALLATDALKTEGVFRVAGDADLVTELKVRIERGHYRLDGIVGVGGSQGDVAVLSSVLKLWLRELEEPLMPASLYERCIQAAEQPSRCMELVRDLPMLHRRVLLYLVSFLQLFTQPPVVRQTRMPAESLALIFAPTLFRSGPERLSMLFNNSKYEQHFMLSLLRHLPCSEVDSGFVPVHATEHDAQAAGDQKVNVGHGKNKSSSGSSTTSYSLHLDEDGGIGAGNPLSRTSTAGESERSIFDSHVRLRSHAFVAAATPKPKKSPSRPILSAATTGTETAAVEAKMHARR
ncbi:hypothetical protein ACQY0O_004696 [Thecaphora frezii]